MAETVITPVAYSDTPFSKKYTLAGDQAGGPGLRTLTQLLADLHEGPLKRVLASISPANLDHLNVDEVLGHAIRIYDVPLTPTDASAVRRLQGTGRTIVWVANLDPGVAGLSCTLPASATLTIEIRLNHTTQA